MFQRLLTKYRVVLGIPDMFSMLKYFFSLSEEDKEGYKCKLTLSDGQILPGPYSLLNNWKSDVALMPDTPWPDIYNYLINTTRKYS